MTENRIFTLCRMITWIVFLRMFWNFISSLPVKRGRSLSFLVGTISNVLVMEIGWTDVGSRGYILVSCAHSNTSLINFVCFLWTYFYITYKYIYRWLFIYMGIFKWFFFSWGKTNMPKMFPYIGSLMFHHCLKKFSVD